MPVNGDYLFPIEYQPGPENNITIEDNTIIDRRFLAKKTRDGLQVAFNEFFFQRSHLPPALHDKLITKNPNYINPAEDHTWKASSAGLYILIHGLKGHPSHWESQAQKLRAEHPEADIAQIRVPKKGNCSLEEAANPIVALARNYILTQPDRPICFFGVSNGSRIALYCEIKLRNTSTPIRVSSVSGILFGSGIMNQLVNRLPGIRGSYDKTLREEIAYGSDKAKEILDAQKEDLPDGVIRSYKLYVSATDTHVWPYHSAVVPLKGDDVQYRIYSGEGHSSILDRVCSEQVESSIHWMKQQVING